MNPGAPMGPLARIASGGELSRLMLALKVVITRGSPAPTLVFDEVDSGIGGAVAAAVGERLQRLGESLQILVVTHSPQVAAKGTHHWRVAKQQGKDRTTTRVDELGPPEFKSNDRFAKPRSLKLTFPEEMYVYDVRAAKSQGKRKDLTLTLDPYEPAVFAVSPVAFPSLEVSVPIHLRPGESAHIGMSFARGSPAATHVFHLDVIDPAGKTAEPYSGNVIASQGHAAKLVPLAYNDPRGHWTVRVKDLLSGQVKTAAFDVD